MRPHARVSEQRRPERGSRHDAARRLGDDIVSRTASEPLGEQVRHPLGADETTGAVEVRAHAALVHLQSFEGVCDRRCRTAREHECPGERLPLRLPRTRGTLVLLLERAGEHGHMAGGDPRTRTGAHRADRVSLLRHRRRSAARVGGLGHLTHLRLCQEHDVEPDLGSGACRDPECRSKLGDPHPVRVPGQRRRREPQLFGKELRHVNALRAEHGQGACRTTELRGKAALAQRAEPGACLGDRDQPSSRLQAEGRRHGLLQERATDHRR